LKLKFCRNQLPISENARKIAEANNFEVKSYKFDALKEDLRQPRIVRIGAVQNSIVLGTSEPINKQRDAIFEKIGKIIDSAALENVNVLCLQEAWSKIIRIFCFCSDNFYFSAMPFAFCTRGNKKFFKFSSTR
jgi:beta-ureidopropionase